MIGLKMIKFQKIKAKNFLSYKDLDFEIPESGLFFVKGDNGAGKSGIFEALCFGLYGKTIRGDSGDAVVRNGRKKGESCSVKINLSVDAVEIEITRKRFPNSVELTINDEDVSLPTMVATQEKIDTVLGMTFDVFTNSVIFGQGLPFRFSQATDSERKKILDRILQFEWLHDARASALAVKQAIERTHIPEFETKLNVERAVGVTIDERIHSGQTELTSVKDQLKAKIEKKKEVDVLKASLLEEQRKLAKILQSREENAKLLQEEETQKVQLVDKLSDCNLKKMKTQNLMGFVSHEIQAYESKKRAVEKLDGGECPTCLQKVGEKHIALVGGKLNGYIQEKKTVYKEYEKALVGRVSDVEDVEFQLSIKRDNISIFLTRIQDVSYSIIRCEESIREINEKLQSQEYGTDSIAYLEQRIEVLQKNLDEAAEKRFASNKLIADTASKLAKANKKIERYDFWVTGFGNTGIKSMVLKNVMPVLNESAKAYADFLTNGELSVVFKAETEAKTGNVIDKLDVVVEKKGAGGTYSLCSGGEKRRADIIVLLSMYDLISRRSFMKVNILIFDEVFEALDSVGIENTVSLLEHFGVEKAVYVIEHRDDMDSFFENVIKVTNSSGGSKISISQ